MSVVQNATEEPSLPMCHFTGLAAITFRPNAVPGTSSGFSAYLLFPKYFLDCVGGVSPGRFTRWLNKRGTYANTLPNAGILLRQLASSIGLGRRVRGVMLRPDGDDLRVLCKLSEANKFRAVIDEVFPLDRVADAHRKSITGRARGKIVVEVAP